MANDGPLLLLDRAARRYGCRPSDLVGLTDEWERLYFDLTAAEAGSALQEDRAKRSKAWPVYVMGGG